MRGIGWSEQQIDEYFEGMNRFREKGIEAQKADEDAWRRLDESHDKFKKLRTEFDKLQELEASGKITREEHLKRAEALQVKYD